MYIIFWVRKIRFILINTNQRVGERLSSDAATTYLNALDFDRNGIVDFGDILSWTAVMKAKSEEQKTKTRLSHVTKVATSMLNRIDPYRALIWLMTAYVIRATSIFRSTKLRQSRMVRTLSTLTILLYILDLLRIAKAFRDDHHMQWLPTLWQYIIREARRCWKILLNGKSL